MKIKKTLLALIAIALLATQMVAATDYTERVNLFLGTASSAQTSPAAILPFGMISPGPFNQPKAPCGYNNRIKELIGFNHTHLQGTGCGSYGLVVMLPTTGNQELGTKVIVPAEKQWAQPGYYKARDRRDGDHR